jgi:hypothetical protein
MRCFRKNGMAQRALNRLDAGSFMEQSKPEYTAREHIDQDRQPQPLNLGSGCLIHGEHIDQPMIGNDNIQGKLGEGDKGIPG